MKEKKRRLKWPKFRSISGFALQHNVIKILNIYNRSPGITPPQFIPIHKELCTGRIGYYVGMAAALKEKDLDELKTYLNDMKID